MDANGQGSGPVEAVFAIFGDPHFVEESGSSSHLKVKSNGDLASTSPRRNPWAGLNDLIAKESLRADAVLCPGDIAFRNDRMTLEAGWRHLLDIGKRLNSQHVMCATGNHDVTSRSISDKLNQNIVANLRAGLGPFEPLKSLSPPYPAVAAADITGAEGREHRVRYFGAGLVLVTSDKYQVLIVNSCCEHGHDPHEFERGTFPTSAASELKLALEQCSHHKISIAIMHHPPEPLTQAGGGAHDFIDNGEELLRQLSDHGYWLVIHGHKHEARLGYAAGAGIQPVIFGAASLAFYVAEQSGTFRNQFYLLKVRLEPNGLIGKFSTWDWFDGRGWARAVPDGDGIYDGAAFGARDAGQVAADIAALTDLPMDWSDVVQKVPSAALLVPVARNQVRRRLLKVYGLHILEDASNGQWLTLERAAS